MADDRMLFDVLLIGGSPSNLILAHRLVDLAIEQYAQNPELSFSIGILEKAGQFGGHICSGTVSNPRVLKKTFPNLDFENSDFPLEAICKESHFSVLGKKNVWNVPRPLVPAGLHKEGYFVLTLSHVVQWLVRKLEEKSAGLDYIHLELLPGFAAHKIVYEGDVTQPASADSPVVGVQVVTDATDNPAEDNIYGQVTCFGDKGFVSRDLIQDFKLRENPQIWSVGVKEVWQLPHEQDFAGQVWHTMGYPLAYPELDGSFGGGFVYGMKEHKLSIGLIASLDSENPNLNPQRRLQDFKKHPWLQKMLAGGKLLKYGAAVLPEGGYYSLPQKFQVSGALLLGDALGVLDVSSLSGVDKSMQCGYLAAEVIYKALCAGDFSEQQLSPYQDAVMESFVGTELYAGRYFRKAWQENSRLLKQYLPTVAEGIDGPGPIPGIISVGLKHNPIKAIADALRLKSMLDGVTDLGPVRYQPDASHIKPNFQSAPYQPIEDFAKDTVYSRPDAVYYAEPHYHEGNRHIDEFNAETCIRCIARYDAAQKEVPCVSDCTAEVHRVDGEIAGQRKHGMSLENCIQCRTCEIICPEINLRVNAADQGSGPVFIGL